MIKKEQKKISLESLDGRLEGVNVRLEGIDMRLEGVDVRLEKVDEKLEGLDKRLGNVEVSQRKAGVQIDRLEYKFDLCLEGFGSLKERADKIGDRIGILEDKI